MANRWFICKGCGKPAVHFVDGMPPYHPPGSVGHSKPTELVGTHGRVPCALFNRLTVTEYVLLHEDAETLEPPVKLTPILDS